MKQNSDLQPPDSTSNPQPSTCNDPEPPVHPSYSSHADDNEAFTRLAALTPAQYDRVRKAEARRLGIRIETLDAEVARCRLEADYDAQARAINLPVVEPWPDPVNGAEVLHQVAERFLLRLILPPGAAHALALWD